MKIAIVIDSSANLNKREAEELGWNLLPLYINIDGKDYADGVDFNALDFFDIYNKESVVKTSASNLNEATKLLTKLSAEFDKVVVYPISMHLSSQYANLKVLSHDFNNVYVVPSENICEYITIDILEFLDKKITTNEQFEDEFSKLGKFKQDQVVLLIPKTTDFLLKGGRLTPAANTLAKIFRIVPIIEFRDGKLLKYGKGHKFVKTVSNLINDAIECSNKNQHLKLAFLEARCSDLKAFLDILKTEKAELKYLYHIPPVVAIHTGPESISIMNMNAQDKHLELLANLRKKSL